MLMDNADYEKGLLLALMTALISGFSVFVNGAAVKLGDPFQYTTLKNLGALIFLFVAAFLLKDFKYFRGLSKKQWMQLVLIGLVGGSIPFLLFFWGLKLGGPAISSFIFRSLFIFAGVFGYLLLKEKPEPKDIAAGLVMLVGNAFLISGPIVFGFGQLLVLGATLLWSLEYTISRKVLASVHPRVVMISRMLFGCAVLIVFLAANDSISSLFAINIEIFAWLVLTSLFLFGFLFTWYNALKYVPVLRATAILALGGVITSVLNMLVGKPITLSVAFGLFLILVGVLVMIGIASILRAISKFKELHTSLME